MDVRIIDKGTSDHDDKGLTNWIWYIVPAIEDIHFPFIMKSQRSQPMIKVSKDIFLTAMDCPGMGWLKRSGHLKEIPSLGDELRMEQGMDIGRRARTLYPKGILVEDGPGKTALEMTNELLDNPRVTVIFEGYFLLDEFVARADILIKGEGGWHMVEVKSSSNDKKEYINDMAYTSMVLAGSGLDVKQTSLAVVSKEFRLGMENERLFEFIDHTEEVLPRSQELASIRNDIDELTRRSRMPEPHLRFECRKCPRFREHLSGGLENHVFDLPRISRGKFQDLQELGVESIEDIPDDFPLTANQERVARSVKGGEIIVESGLGRELDRIKWPALYLDFETFMTAIPLFPDMAPYTQVPFQYSIHRYDKIGVETGHFEYLAQANLDCRRELAEGLLRDLEGGGSILIYTSFEKRVIRYLAEICPDLSEGLNLLIDRMVDLEAIIRKNFYHPAFHGSTSIKKTLPALVPEMSYDGMAIGEGDSAMAHFTFMAWGKYDVDKINKTRNDLLEYCKLDTLAMVKLHERLIEYLI